MCEVKDDVKLTKYEISRKYFKVYSHKEAVRLIEYESPKKYLFTAFDPTRVEVHSNKDTVKLEEYESPKKYFEIHSNKEEKKN